MVKTRRSSRNKRKTTRRRHYKKGGGPKVAPKSESEKKKDEVKIMAQPPHHSAAHPPPQFSFVPEARASLLLGAHADHMLRHLRIPWKTPHHDPQSAMRVPLDSARAHVMVGALYASVDRLCARGDFANAVVQLDRAVAIGSMRARVELADIMCSGRVGVPQNIARACALLNDTEARRNPDCMGLRAFLQLRDVCAMDEVVTDHPEYAHHIQYRDAEREAEYSSGEGSKYGHFAYGSFEVVNEITNDDPIAGGFDDDMHMDSITAFENSASDNYFRAQTVLGCSWYYTGYDDDRSLAMAKRFFTLAAEQGYPLAMHNLGVMCCKESMREHDVPGDEAVHWFNLAAAVPFSPAVDALKVLNEYKHDKAVRIDSIRVVCNEWPGEMMLPDITSRY
jgi:TPR repeat protein